MSSFPIRMWDIRMRWNDSRIEFFPCARCRDPSPGWHRACKVILMNYIRIPQEDMWRAPLSRLPQGETPGTREHHTWTIAYPIRICCPDHCSAAILSGRPVWTSFTPCIADLLMAKDFKASVLHVYDLSIALPWIPKNSPQSLICFGDQKAIKTPKLNTIWLELIARVLNMLIGLKGDNYYSKVFIRVNYKLSNSTFWVVITKTLIFLCLDFVKWRLIIWSLCSIYTTSTRISQA